MAKDSIDYINTALEENIMIYKEVTLKGAYGYRMNVMKIFQMMAKKLSKVKLSLTITQRII